MMIHELSQGVAKLNEEILAEEKRTGVSDRMHVCYSTYAKAAAQRRDNLIRTLEELRLRGDGQRSIAA
jgi:flagellar protein FliJ